MIIVFVTNNYKPYSGGVVSSIDTSVDALRACGHTVYIITLSFLKNAVDEPHVLRIPCPIKFKYKKNHMAIAWRAQKFLKDTFQQLQPDVVHVHHPFLLGVAAVRAARTCSLPIVFTYHTLYEHYTHYVPFFGRMMRTFIKKRSFEFCNKVDAVIAPSKTIEDYLQKNGVQKSIHTVPSAIASVYFQEKKQKNKEDTIFRLLTVSRFAKEKSISFLLDAYALLDAEKFSLTLVGYGEYGDFLRAYAFDVLKLSTAQVQFVERPNKQMLAHLYVHADLFIFASTTETQGLVLCEAMGAGLPVVARNGPGQQDIIVQGCNGFLVDTHQEMVQKIQHISRSAALQKQLSAGAHTTAQKFSSLGMAEKLLHAYRGLM